MRAIYVPPELEESLASALAARGLFLRVELKGAHARPVLRETPAFLREMPLMAAQASLRAVA